MKLNYLYALLLLLCINEFDLVAQRRVAMVKEPNIKIHVYKAPKNKSGTVAMIDNKTLFYVDSSIGNYYSFDMSHIHQGLIDGYVKKDDVKPFSSMTDAEQKKMLIQVFDS